MTTPTPSYRYIARVRVPTSLSSTCSWLGYGTTGQDAVLDALWEARSAGVSDCPDCQLTIYREETTGRDLGKVSPVYVGSLANWKANIGGNTDGR